MRPTIVVMLATVLAGAASCGKSEPPPPPSTPATEHEAHTGPPQSLADWARGAKLFDGLGDFHRPVTTSVGDAQKYFDQGMRLLWAFNHDESTRSFARAAELDPTCAMCFWGVALTVGPNYNVPMMAEPRAKVAFETLQQAQQQAPHTKPVEQALIAALAKRYQSAQPLDPSNSGPVLTAYAGAMRDVAAEFKDDADVQVLFAESMMNLNPWKLWTLDGKPAPGTQEIQATFERVLANDPRHPGANHYYIHTMEASTHPDKALASAERLRGMMPAAGHLQHMPAHIMQRVGRYEDAARANREGVTADVAYMGATPPLDYYGMYLAHNYQFLAYSAAMSGKKAEAIQAAMKMRDTIPVDMLLAMPGVDWYVSEIYTTMIRFGMWEELLAEKAPDPRLKALGGGYYYGRAVAAANKGYLDEARNALGQLNRIARETPADAGAGLNMARDVLAVASLVARGEVARAEGKTADAVARFREAVAKEDQLAYDEPSDWFLPVRHQLGAVLLKLGRASEAETVYRDDLARHPQNGWALFGLVQALTALKKTDEAAKVQAQFKAAWVNADVTLFGSIF